MMTDLQKKIADFIDRQGVSFLGSVDEFGFPNTKAMLPPRRRKGLTEFFFSTNTSSMRVQQYRQNPKACLYFCDSLRFQGVMLTGNIEVYTDKKSKEMIWENGDTLYYPKGVIDPDYCVLKFTVMQGRYYKNMTSKTFELKE